jgi:hypothetical protein
MAFDHPATDAVAQRHCPSARHAINRESAADSLPTVKSMGKVRRTATMPASREQEKMIYRAGRKG